MIKQSNDYLVFFLNKFKYNLLTSNKSEEHSKAFENLKRHCLGLNKNKASLNKII